MGLPFNNRRDPRALLHHARKARDAAREKRQKKQQAMMQAEAVRKEEERKKYTAADRALVDVQEGRTTMGTFMSIWDNLFGAPTSPPPALPPPAGPMVTFKRPVPLASVTPPPGKVPPSTGLGILQQAHQATMAQAHQAMMAQAAMLAGQQRAAQAGLANATMAGQAAHMSTMNDMLRGVRPLHVNPPASAITDIRHAQENNLRTNVMLDTVSIWLRNGTCLVVRVASPKLERFEPEDMSLSGATIEAVLVDTDRGPDVDTLRMLIPQTPLDEIDAEKQAQEHQRRMHRLSDIWPTTTDVLVDDPKHINEGDDEGI